MKIILPRYHILTYLCTNQMGAQYAIRYYLGFAVRHQDRFNIDKHEPGTQTEFTDLGDEFPIEIWITEPNENSILKWSSIEDQDWVFLRRSEKLVVFESICGPNKYAIAQQMEQRIDVVTKQEYDDKFPVFWTTRSYDGKEFILN